MLLSCKVLSGDSVSVTLVYLSLQHFDTGMGRAAEHKMYITPLKNLESSFYLQVQVWC